MIESARTPAVITQKVPGHCAGGAPWQQYHCLHPSSSAAVGHAGYITGEYLIPVLLAVLVLWALSRLVRRARSGKAATAAPGTQARPGGQIAELGPAAGQ
jgi:hypothetical protein